MLFNFRLTPLETVPAWGSGSDLHLHWFGLSYGCFWLQAGDFELFRYSQQILERPGWDKDYFGCSPHADYQVVRLWEDTLGILPDVLSPVPQALFEKLAAPNFQVWRAAVYKWALSKPNGFQDAAYGNATEWARKRQLWSEYLEGSPDIWFWNDGTHIHLEWDNRDRQEEGVPVWAARMGSWKLPVAAFLDEVRAFDEAFIQAMQHRVEQIAGGWSRQDVHVDIDQLVREQADRAARLAQSLDRAQRPSEDWHTILDVVAAIDAEIEP